MSVLNHIQNNEKLANRLKKATVFICDFETLSDKNTFVNEQDLEATAVYLWGISYSKSIKEDILWGTDIEDFWNVIHWINNNSSTTIPKKIMFVNLSFDYTFFKHLLYSTYKRYYGEYIDFLNERPANQFYVIKSGSQILRITISLPKGKKLIIECLWKKTSLSVKKMGDILALEKGPWFKEFLTKGEIDYNLVKKVPKREVLYEKVYGEPQTFDNFLRCNENKESKYGNLISYLRNDVLIPIYYYTYFIKLIKNTNAEISNIEGEYELSQTMRGPKLTDKKGKKVDIIKYLNWRDITTSSIAFKGAKMFLGKEKVKEYWGNVDEAKFGREDFHLINRSFTGGFTQFNKQLANDDRPVISFDINSSYPAIMENDLPYGDLLYTRPEGTHIEYINLNITSFKVKRKYKNKIPPLFAKTKTHFKITLAKEKAPENRYLYFYTQDMGAFNTTFLKEEWDLITQHYDIEYQIVKSFYFKTKPYLNKYIKGLKDIKNNAQDIGLKNFGKLLLNSIYGKLAQGPILQNDMLVDFNNTDDLNDLKVLATEHAFINFTNQSENMLSAFQLKTLTPLFTNKQLRFDKIIPWIKWTDKERNRGEIKYYKKLDSIEYLEKRQVGSYITAKGRLALLKVILFFGWENVRYADTDSVYLIDDGIEEKMQESISKGIWQIDDSIFGAWKPEKKITNMKVIGAKQYRLKIKQEYKNGMWYNKEKWFYSMAGLRNAGDIFEEIGHEKFEVGYVLKNVSLKSKEIYGGTILRNMDFKITEGEY